MLTLHAFAGLCIRDLELVPQLLIGFISAHAAVLIIPIEYSFIGIHALIQYARLLHEAPVLGVELLGEQIFHMLDVIPPLLNILAEHLCYKHLLQTAVRD